MRILYYFPSTICNEVLSPLHVCTKPLFLSSPLWYHTDERREFSLLFFLLHSCYENNRLDDDDDDDEGEEEEEEEEKEEGALTRI